MIVGGRQLLGDRTFGIVLLIPAFAIIVGIILFPLLDAARLSITSTNLINIRKQPLVGLRNYQLILNQPTFQDAISNNAKLLLAVPVIIVISVLIAIVLFERVRGWRVYRTILFVPYILSVPIVAVVLKNIFQFNGPFNETARALGMEFLALDWLGDPNVAIWTIMIVVIWREVGFGIVLMLSRLLGLNAETLEAAQLDGASWRQRVIYVIVPQMRGIIEFYAVVNIIGMVAAVFAYVFMVTKGGPGTSTQTVAYYLWEQVWQFNKFAFGAAASMLLLILFSALIFTGIWLMMRERNRLDRERAS
jgi:ABC-type sugar transport system permease subunit